MQKNSKIHIADRCGSVSSAFARIESHGWQAQIELQAGVSTAYAQYSAGSN
jgi:hypothetical protein